jgi:lysozyme
MNIHDQLLRDEGMRLKPYEDTAGKVTIGVGRNLTDVGITADEAMVLLSNDLENTTRRLCAVLPWAAALQTSDPIRFAALLNMAFNIGVGGLLHFQNMLSFVKAGAWVSAADEMLRSKWSTDVGHRAIRLSLQMKTGEWQ